MVANAQHFALSSDEDIKRLMELRKSKSTNNATRLWIAHSENFWKKKLTLNWRKSAMKSWVKFSFCSIFLWELKKGEKYKSTTLKAMQAALNRYFKDTRGIDITQDKNFIKANELFLGLLKENKKEGRGQVEHKKVLTDQDKELLFMHFETRMTEDPDPKILQQICLFNIIYYMGRRGRENLCSMEKSMFEIQTGMYTQNRSRHHVFAIAQNCGKILKLFFKEMASMTHKTFPCVVGIMKNRFQFKKNFHDKIISPK